MVPAGLSNPRAFSFYFLRGCAIFNAMNTYAFADMETLFMALADATRLRILKILDRSEVCVADLSDALSESQPKISRHLAYLRRAGLVETRRDGKWIYYRMSVPKHAGHRAILNETLASIGSVTEEVNNIYELTDMKDTGETVHHNELEEFLL